MTFEEFKHRYLLKLKEQGLISNDEEVFKMYTAVNTLEYLQIKKLKQVRRERGLR